ncbi:leucine-rich repeat protein [Flammeovirga kamogawensis]|uniref:Leucine-rich repeat protein n=1 Tax=Flammeovirga kamogawensis TaxID=373891 RepID=A0ABX8GZ35_9BACT|nr:leucine-rich repeat protein [Flammeovirga kamogawensis]MBB6459105.1 putative repeat protein (TIGR02543 family) [Flammeovirga kamogawensis]QWG08674.1 leucine-rich repeat protein [Flammeovirga kamogawensis]TRX66967.1 leucine-rich repeat protein [Flammeovirga kamogawensis]
MKTSLTMSWLLWLSLLIPTLSYGQYTLTDDDVVVDENGYIQSTTYTAGGDIIIPEVLDGQTVLGIADKNYTNGVFLNKGITSVIFPESLTFIGAYAFMNNKISGELKLPDGLTSIGISAFENNKISGELIFQKKIITIGDYAFYNNNISGELIFPEGIEYIGTRSFRYNSNISTIKFPMSLSIFVIGTFRELTAEGYEPFDGWYIDVTYETPVEITLENVEGKTIYGKWTPSDYTLTYEGGFAAHNNPSEYTIETPTIELSNEGDRDGYKVEWFTSINYDTLVSEITTGSFGDTTLYGKETIIDYTINYPNEGIHTNPFTFTIESETITFKNPTDSLGYTFAGWFTDVELTQPITSLPKGSTGNLSVYAKWTLQEFTISYNGVDDSYTGVTSFTINDENITLVGVDKENYTFEGWFTTSDFQENSKIEVIETALPQDYTLYAKLVEAEITSVEGGLPQEIIVYPNPAKASFQINKIVDSIHLINSAGMEIKDYSKATSFDVSTLPNGIYYIKGEAEGKSFNQKIVVKH